MKKFLAVPIGIFLAGAVFMSVVALIWPGRDVPVWASRVSTCVFLTGLVAAGVLAWRYWREPS